MKRLRNALSCILLLLFHDERHTIVYVATINQLGYTGRSGKVVLE